MCNSKFSPIWDKGVKKYSSQSSHVFDYNIQLMMGASYTLNDKVFSIEGKTQDSS